MGEMDCGLEVQAWVAEEKFEERAADDRAFGPAKQVADQQQIVADGFWQPEILAPGGCAGPGAQNGTSSHGTECR
jgi:hypothetical protein